MKRQVTIVITAAFFTAVCTIPAFAHCHGNRSHNNYRGQEYCYTCEASCEDGYLCGVDGHYCEQHRDGDCCTGNIESQAAYGRGHHHHHSGC